MIMYSVPWVSLLHKHIGTYQVSDLETSDTLLSEWVNYWMMIHSTDSTQPIGVDDR